MLYGLFTAGAELCRSHTVLVGHTCQLIYSLRVGGLAALWVGWSPAEPDSGLWLESVCSLSFYAPQAPAGDRGAALPLGWQVFASVPLTEASSKGQLEVKVGGSPPALPEAMTKAGMCAAPRGSEAPSPRSHLTLVNFTGVILNSHPFPLNYGPREARRGKNSAMLLQPSYHRSEGTDGAAEAQGDSAAGALWPEKQFSV